MLNNDFIVVDFKKCSLILDSRFIHDRFSGPESRLPRRKLSPPVSVFCMVLTTNEDLTSKAKAVNETWGKRCNQTIFITNRPSTKKDVVYLKTVRDGRNHLTQKVMLSLEYVYSNFGNHDWYLKADDDTYIVMDNLRHLLSYYDRKEPVYLGQNFKFYLKHGYNSGGAGYVLSKPALRKLTQGLNSKICKLDGKDEDVDVATCLEFQGVAAYDTKDKLNRETFHSSTLEDHVVGPLSKLLQRYPSTRAKTVGFYFR